MEAVRDVKHSDNFNISIHANKPDYNLYSNVLKPVHLSQLKLKITSLENKLRKLVDFDIKTLMESHQFMVATGNMIWIASPNQNLTEKLHLFNTAIMLTGTQSMVKHRMRSLETASRNNITFPTHTEETFRKVKPIPLTDFNAFHTLNTSKFITTIFITYSLEVINSPIRSQSVRLNQYRNMLPIDKYFQCTGSEKVITWSKGDGKDLKNSCSEDITTLKIHSIDPDPRYYTYHRWKHHFRTRISGFSKKVHDFSHDWDINCVFCWQLPNFATYVVIVQNAVVAEPGVVVQVDDGIKVIPVMCQRKGYVLGPSKITPDMLNNSPKIVSVLVISVEFQGSQKKWNMYHTFVECLSKLAMYVDFLRTNPEVAIHVNGRMPRDMITKNFFKYWGLNNPIVMGSVYAQLVYIPTGNPCFAPDIYNLQTTQQHFRQVFNLDEVPTDSILYIQRTKSRRILQDKEIVSFLQQLARQFGLSLITFSDVSMPSFSESVDLFHRSAIIIGAHGAGLSNIIMAKPRSAVIEVVCDFSPATFKQMSYKLGLRHHAFYGEKVGKNRCDDGISITDISKFKDNVENILQIVLEDLK